MGTKNEWDVSVCKESLNGEGTILQSTEHGFRSMSLKNREFSANTVPFTSLSEPPVNLSRGFPRYDYWSHFLL